MISEHLRKSLFRADAHTYAVLDGASVPDLPERLFEFGPDHECLYRGELADDLVHVAPYLVYLFPEERFTEWLLHEFRGKHWGIFAQSPASLTAIRKHFRTLLTVDSEDGRPMLFRFYDPRVLPPFLLTCNAAELGTIFGPVRHYFAEVAESNDVLRYGFEKGKLKETRLPAG
jgi:hypothetical protein